MLLWFFWALRGFCSVSIIDGGGGMSLPCKPGRYDATSFERVISRLLQLIAEHPEGMTRCEIEEVAGRFGIGFTNSAIAQALLDLVERGQIETQSDWRTDLGWVTVWVTA